MEGTKVKKLTLILVSIVVVLASMNVVLCLDLSRTRSALNEAREELTSVSGIIVSLDRVEYEESGEVRYIGLLRLTTDDGVNGVGVGEISDYRLIMDEYVELEVGNLVSGVPIGQETPALKVEHITPFFHPPIVNTGEYINFEVVELNTMGPSLHLGLQNLGEKDIISVRAEVNGTAIPFFFGVDKEHPVKPYGYMQYTVPTSWFDPSLNETKGFTPVYGETYPVVVKLTLSDDRPFYTFKNVKTWNFSATAVSFGSIVTMIDTGTHIEIEALCLFEKTNNEDFLSVEVWNIWNKTVTKINILVDDKPVAAVETSLRRGQYWKASMRLPFNIYLGSSHNVTIQASTAEGETAEVSRAVRCDRM